MIRPAADARPNSTELRALVRLAIPVAITQLGFLTMGLVDTWMVGRLGPAELGAVALADSILFTLLVLAMGVVGALDPLISQAHVAVDPARCAAAWRAGLRLSVALSVPLVAGVLALGPALERFGGQDPEVVRAAVDYLIPRCLGVLPSLWFMANRCLLNGVGSTRPAMVVTLLANLVNGALDWALIFGHWGLPALGVAGSGLATAGSSWFMCLGLLAWIRWHPAYAPYRAPAPPSRALVGRALRIGLPIGLAQTVEVGAFSVCAIFMGWLSVTALAAHVIALKMASTSFMVAVALGIATSIRVGNLVGARRPLEAQRAAWTGLVAGLVCMSVSAAVFVAAGTPIVAAFTEDAAVIALGAQLMLIAAAFQLVDGAQAIASGALRGAGDTLRPLLAQAAAHWGVAIPLGAGLAFGYGLSPEAGARAIWWGLALGLAVAAAQLTLRVRHIHRTRPLEEEEEAEPCLPEGVPAEAPA